MPDFDSLFGLFGTFMVVMIAAGLVVTGLVIGVFVWVMRRTASAFEDPAVAELKQRYARGEIDPAEFEVRLRSLTQER